MKRILYILLLNFLILGSCYKDKGNYDYNPIPKIEMKGMGSEYDVLTLDQLQVDPQFINKEDYVFLWTLFNEKIVDTISKEPILDYIVLKNPGTYTLALTVENKKNQDRQVFKSKVVVETPFTNGWYILKAIDGRTEVDQITKDWEVSPNLLKNIQGSSLAGKPVGLAYTKGISYIDPVGEKHKEMKILWALSDQDGRTMRIDNINLAYNLNQAFFTWIPNQENRAVQQRLSSLTYYSNQGLYDLELAIGSFMHRFGDRVQLINPASGASTNYVLSKRSYMVSGYNMYYDELNSRFLIYKNGYLFQFMDTDRRGIQVEVKPNGMNSDLLYLGRSTNNGYAIMRNRNSLEYGAYKLELNAINTDYTYYAPILKYKQLPKSMKITEANVFANNAELPYIFYSTGTDVNMYDVDNDKESLNIIPNQDGKVTYLKHLYWRSLGNPSFEYFIVGTEKDGRYKLSFYQMLAGRPDLSKEVKVVEGEGSVHDLQFIHPQMSNYNYNIYPQQ